MGVHYQLSTVVIIFSALTLYPLGSHCTAVSDNGLGSNYSWLALEDGLLKAKTSRKPVMLVIHKSWCGACKALKPEFATSKGIKTLSSHFIMVNTMDNEEPSDKKYAPDGGYIPRILFLSPEGEILEDIANEGGNPSYKYYYFNVNDIISSMKKVIDLYETSDVQDEL